MTFPHQPVRLFRMACAVTIAATLLLAGSCAPHSEETGARPPFSPAGKLTGWLLVAAPNMADPRFVETVIFIVRHDDDGAMGLVVNRPIGFGPASKLLAKPGGQGARDHGDGKIRLHYGGPVQPGKGFVLHSGDYAQDGTVVVTDTVSMTVNPEILRAFAARKGPKRGFVAMGYAGWGAGQLENEIRRKDWVVVPSDRTLVFGTDTGSVWRRALARRGVDL